MQRRNHTNLNFGISNDKKLNLLYIKTLEFKANV